MSDVSMSDAGMPDAGMSSVVMSDTNMLNNGKGSQINMVGWGARARGSMFNTTPSTKGSKLSVPLPSGSLSSNTPSGSSSKTSSGSPSSSIIPMRIQTDKGISQSSATTNSTESGYIKGTVEFPLEIRDAMKKFGWTRESWLGLNAKGLPIYDNHKYWQGQIGEIVGLYVDDEDPSNPMLGIEAKIYKETEPGRSVHRDILDGKINFLSLGGEYMMSPSGIVFNKKLEEVSVTPNPKVKSAVIKVRQSNDASEYIDNQQQHQQQQQQHSAFGVYGTNDGGGGGLSMVNDDNNGGGYTANFPKLRPYEYIPNKIKSDMINGQNRGNDSKYSSGSGGNEFKNHTGQYNLPIKPQLNLTIKYDPKNNNNNSSTVTYGSRPINFINQPALKIMESHHMITSSTPAAGNSTSGTGGMNVGGGTTTPGMFNQSQNIPAASSAAGGTMIAPGTTAPNGQQQLNTQAAVVVGQPPKPADTDQIMVDQSEDPLAILEQLKGKGSAELVEYMTKLAMEKKRSDEERRQLEDRLSKYQQGELEKQRKYAEQQLTRIKDFEPVLSELGYDPNNETHKGMMEYLMTHQDTQQYAEWWSNALSSIKTLKEENKNLLDEKLRLTGYAKGIKQFASMEKRQKTSANNTSPIDTGGQQHQTSFIAGTNTKPQGTMLPGGAVYTGPTLQRPDTFGTAGLSRLTSPITNQQHQQATVPTTNAPQTQNISGTFSGLGTRTNVYHTQPKLIKVAQNDSGSSDGILSPQLEGRDAQLLEASKRLTTNALGDLNSRTITTLSGDQLNMRGVEKEWLHAIHSNAYNNVGTPAPNINYWLPSANPAKRNSSIAF